jgi:monofunctional biosynthetic peptidoglycan transglycosylase
MWKRLLVAIPLATIGAAWFYFLVLPWPIFVRTRNPDTTALMRQRIAEARSEGEELDIRQEWVPLDRVARRLRRAVIVAEDGNFYEHEGIDWLALREEFRYRGDDDFSWFSPADVRALFGSLQYYLNNRSEVRGRSTITQQLAKNLYFSTDRSVLRKFDEMIVARRLEWFLTKDRILEVYLNVVEWGPGIFGAQAASERYFDRSAANLSADQAASLAATLPHPLSINPARSPGRMGWRKRLILARMGGSGPVQTVPLAPVTAPVDTATKPIGDPVAADSTVIPDTTKPPVKPDTVIIDTISRHRPMAF